ncbi:MAG: anthranilate phosphoribosyltransferase [Nitrososphaeraceae archaeon]|nr:anthranilate phosphoribosyltransferase [Nitrososphaeraceae archaeon]
MSSTNFADLGPVIRKLVSRINLTENEIRQSVNSILRGEASDASIASFLVGLAMKGETAKEIKAILQTVNEHAIKITPKVSGTLIDTCGTGGDAIKSFNISTAAAIVASSAGGKVAKHGNRSFSGYCGSADFLEYVGLDLNSNPANVRQVIEKTGIGFLYSPRFHPAMRNAASARKTIGIRTVFNIVGPLCNPCTNISAQLVGVFERSLLEIIPVALQDAYENGLAGEAMVIHAFDGFDELSNTCENDIVWLVKRQIKRTRLHPNNVNIQVAKPEQLFVYSKEGSIRDTLQSIYGIASQEKEDIVVLNASAALVIGKIAKDFREGVEIARSAIKEEKPQKKLAELIYHCGDKEKLVEAEKKFIYSC